MNHKDVGNISKTIRHITHLKKWIRRLLYQVVSKIIGGFL